MQNRTSTVNRGLVRSGVITHFDVKEFLESLIRDGQQIIEKDVCAHFGIDRWRKREDYACGKTFGKFVSDVQDNIVDMQRLDADDDDDAGWVDVSALRKKRRERTKANQEAANAEAKLRAEAEAAEAAQVKAERDAQLAAEAEQKRIKKEAELARVNAHFDVIKSRRAATSTSTSGGGGGGGGGGDGKKKKKWWTFTKEHDEWVRAAVNEVIQSRREQRKSCESHLINNMSDRGYGAASRVFQKTKRTNVMKLKEDVQNAVKKAALAACKHRGKKTMTFSHAKKAEHIARADALEINKKLKKPFGKFNALMKKDGASRKGVLADEKRMEKLTQKRAAELAQKMTEELERSAAEERARQKAEKALAQEKAEELAQKMKAERKQKKAAEAEENARAKPNAQIAEREKRKKQEKQARREKMDALRAEAARRKRTAAFEKRHADELAAKRELNAKCLELARAQLVKKRETQEGADDVSQLFRGVVLPFSTAKVKRPSDGCMIPKWKKKCMKEALREQALEASEHIMERADEITTKLLDDRDLNDLDEKAVQKEVMKLRDTGYREEDVMHQARIIVRGKIEYQRKRADEKRAKLKKLAETKEVSKLGKRAKKAAIQQQKHLAEGSRRKHRQANRNNEMRQDIQFGLVEMDRQIEGEVKSISSDAALGCVLQMRYEKRFETNDHYRANKRRLKEENMAKKMALWKKDISRAEKKKRRQELEAERQAKIAEARAERERQMGKVGDISLEEYESGQDRLRRSGAKIRQEVGKLKARAKRLSQKAKKKQQQIDGMAKKADKARKTAHKGKGKW